MTPLSFSILGGKISLEIKANGCLKEIQKELEREKSCTYDEELKGERKKVLKEEGIREYQGKGDKRQVGQRKWKSQIVQESRKGE